MVTGLGVRGCGRQGVYMLTLTGSWVMNTDTETARAETGGVTVQ